MQQDLVTYKKQMNIKTVYSQFCTLYDIYNFVVVSVIKNQFLLNIIRHYRVKFNHF